MAISAPSRPTAKYPVPGRGAWHREGGLLPGKPGAKGSTGYYRLNAGAETPVGAGWLREEDPSHAAYVVHLGVKVIQRLVDIEQDGWFGPATSAAVIAAQRALNVEADGIIGRQTMKALLAQDIQGIAAAHSVPATILGGLVTVESALDPAAVGINGADHGLAQINLYAHGDDVRLEEALDADYSLHWAAADLSEEYNKWQNRTTADRWDIAIAHHNSPLLAKRWALEGAAPVVAGRLFQIGDYVANIRSAY